MKLRRMRQVVELEITNKFIMGSIHLTKYDADYPDHKLSGAEFEVYLDSNGNKKLDDEDELLGTMDETEPGEYEMADLRFNGYLVKRIEGPGRFLFGRGGLLCQHRYRRQSL